MIANAKGDNGIEVATIVNEGMVGLPAFLGAETAAMRVFVQVSGDALRMPVETFRKHCASNEDLTQVLLRYTQALMTQIVQSSACNRLHPIEKRCARWLLMTHDRVEGDKFPLTQEFLSKMLGARRGTVSATARALQQADLIDYKRGVITIVNRDRLESAAYESMIRGRRDVGSAGRLSGPTVLLIQCGRSRGTNQIQRMIIARQLLN